jgi:hypothetical protein
MVRPIILCVLTWWPVICCVLTWWDHSYIISWHGDQLYVMSWHGETSYTLCPDIVRPVICCALTRWPVIHCALPQWPVTCTLYLYTVMTCCTMHHDSIVTNYSCLCCWQSSVHCSCYQQNWNKIYCLYLTHKTVPKFVNRDVPDFELFQSVITSSDKSGWDHMAVDWASSTLLQLQISLSAQTSSGFR